VTETSHRTVHGLSEAEAARRLAADGPNRVESAPPVRLTHRVLRQFADPLVALLLAAAVVTALLRDMTDTAVIALVVVVNTAIGVAQEVRADRAIAALHRLSAPTARVIRDGVNRMVPAADLVRGDTVVLAAGDIVPADLALSDSQRLRLDEAALTGESLPVNRAASDDVHAGTVVVTGRAVGTVVRTGKESALGRIAALVAAARPGPTPLQRRLAGLGRALGAIAVALSAVVLVLGLVAGRPLVQMAITAVSLVVAAVPESLPAVVTLALALGAYRMARGHAIARRLPAVETLGSVTVVASDKTGTVTEGRMSVRRAVTADGRTCVVRGVGYEPTGSVDGTAPPVALARAAVLCNDAHLVPPTGDAADWGVAGDPLEGALIAFAGRCGVDAATERAAALRVAEQPFDPLTRRMVTVHSRPGRRFLVVCKGAPEVVLTPNVVDASPDQLASAVSTARTLAENGLRVLAFAAGETDGPSGDPAHGLHLLGLIGIADPVRDGAAEVAETFRRAGIRLVLITGDHPATAARVAGQLGTWRDGDEVARGDDGDLSRHDPERVHVYARIRPEQKLDIIAALQKRGHVVAMTGDGVNDAPALRRADIGVAMGRSGTEVARQAADLVLTDDNLATIAAAVGEGRRIYANIRRFLRYALSGGVAELAVMLLGPFLGLAVPLLPAQILWVNLLTHGLPGVAFGAEPASPGTMRRPPRSPQESVLGGGLARTVLGAGALIATCVLGAALVVRYAGGPWQSVAFVVLGLAQLGVALAVRAPRQRGGPRNPALGAAVALSAVLQIVAVEWTPLMHLLGTQRLTVAQLAACVGVATLPCAALLATRALRRRLRPQELPPAGTDSPKPRADARTG
jgi:Ca2+-transporting ATPase